LSNLVNLFGGYGYIGSEFRSKFPCIVNEKNDLVPKLTDNVTDILYLISTIDNHTMKVNPYIDIETNLTTLIRVLENFRMLNRPDMIFNFASSWFVYGNTEVPAKETSVCNPIGFYSITKRTAEQLLISYCQTHNLKYRILRFGNVIGNNDSKVSEKKNVLTFLLNKIQNNESINIYQEGKFYRDYIHVSDLCDAIQLIMNKFEVNDIINVSNGEPVQFIDVIQYAIEKYNSTSEITFMSGKETMSMYLDTSKLKDLDYQKKISVFDFVDNYKNF
jgi:nucleoside-diphosphate-sugar epimerase